MSECVEKLPHECGTSDGLQVFQDSEGEFNGYCFSCGTYVPDPYEGEQKPVFKPKTSEEKRAQVQSIKSYPIKGLPSRRLEEETLKYFGVHVAVSEQDGETPVGVFFPYGTGTELAGFKFRDLIDKKRQWIIGTNKGANMFGWGRAIRSGSKVLYITEGEFDAMALYQILKDGDRGTVWEGRDPAVISVKNGAGGAVKDFMQAQPEIRKHFQDIVLVFDNDEAGRGASEAVARVASDVKVATLPAKDANECLIQGASKAARASVLFRSVVPKNTRLVYGSSLREQAHTPAVMGLSTPWPRLTELTRGIRRGETWYFGAGVKMGKSEIVNALAEHLITEHKQKVFLCKPEEQMAKSYKMLVGKAAGRIFHDPNIPFDEEAWAEYEPLIGDNAIFCDAYQFVGWDALKEDIRYAVVQDGVSDVMIDPITCLTNQMSSADANEALTSMTAELSAMAIDHNFTAYMFCHLKAPGQGQAPHERGGPVLSTQFAGSRAMMRTCNYMIGMRGNKDPELPLEERNMRYIELLEDREFGASGIVPLYWDHHTGLFNEAGI